ncbi:threonyl-tRNA synthetase [Williamsoniiplasma somnilux]|uniref:Threonine--tRNA ligase n=1 Tax=Williamsoniiplasma somnilux TaxID=215578 RepID=A0A2K8P1Z8_9MOLU|nr:threonine--tRNA ligase [Williamsoniiplasma somnilux]ATZ18923.1 threonyl-tRNA synthetase [Williamsoniiplasma somnilux]
MKVKLLDGNIKEYQKPISIKDIASNLGVSLGKSVVGAYVNKIPVDLDYVVEKDIELELITNKSDDKYDLFINHTSALLTAFAINDIFGAKIAQTFYKKDGEEFAVTFEVEPRIGLDELEKIQNKVNEYLANNDKINIEYVDLETATKILKNNEYQLFLAKKQFAELNYVTIYSLNNLKIVNIQPIITDLKHIKAIRVQQLTGSYWLDDAKNIMLQRVHGMGADSLKELNSKIALIEDRKSRDHRTINKRLNIFGFDNLIGAGLPLWLPNGVIIKDEIKKYLKEKEWEYDYIQVQTPIMGTVDLYKTSGHWDHYREDMFQPFNGGRGSEEQFVLKPMSCPHHVSLYKQEQRSYRDLPLRMAEHALQHRYESSGSLTGLERVRAMELTDSHIFVRPDQVKEEFKNVYKLVQEALKGLKIEIDYVSFSVRDPEDKEKYFQDDEMWNHAEEELENVLKDLKLNYTKMVGEAAFYGPKLDIQIKTAQNHEVTISTIQLDFLLPRKFDATYVDQHQKLQRPIMIHRGLVGTYERLVAIILEQTNGILPLWLSPTQVEIIPIGDDKNFEYADKLRDKFKNEFIRSHIDLRDERLAWKIREAQIHKIPYQLVIGDEETKNNTITYRQYASEEEITMPTSEFITKIMKEIKERQ